ncbi:MAG: hypothetical protein Q9O62_12510 [Ardenticatenia bacterium]|nr:hypothetical protein [Ardenticatenia bacterium]
MAVLTKVKPTAETLFHIQWDWFRRNHVDTEVLLREQLCAECRQALDEGKLMGEVDWIDPDTGEVFRMDAVREAILSHCRWKPEYISATTPLITAVFRTLLANNNCPLSAHELAQRLTRWDPETILTVLSRGDVKWGITPTNGE